VLYKTCLVTAHRSPCRRMWKWNVHMYLSSNSTPAQALTSGLTDKINGSSKLGEAAGLTKAKWQTRLKGLVFADLTAWVELFLGSLWLLFSAFVLLPPVTRGALGYVENGSLKPPPLRSSTASIPPSRLCRCALHNVHPFKGIIGSCTHVRSINHCHSPTV
jgi:hypothetical protein